MHSSTSIFALITFTLFLIACGGSDPSSLSLNEVNDPVEGAFTIQLPEGWRHEVALKRPGGQIRSCIFAQSPNRKTSLFWGDAKLPTYMLPNQQYGMRTGMNLGNPMMRVQPFMHAEAFFRDYVQKNYGQLPGFRLTATQAHPTFQRWLEQEAAKYGFSQSQITSVKVNFEFEDGGQMVQAQINGTTFGMEQIWMADVAGFICTGDTVGVEKLLLKVMSSKELNQQWQQRENARNQEQARQSAAAHRQRMASQQAAFDAHQRMMQDRYAAADAQHQNWMNNQAAQERQHDQFIDMIRDEETVTNGYQTGKVEAGYNQYYVNPNTGEYVGTNAYQNPDVSVYELWKKKY
ncbi:MAG: hypothetical protein AAF804_07510 [Bacteroidota bacterium]